MAKQKKRINLALQGGGTHGALAWGILDYLLEDGRLVIDSICATSAGATNAAVLAQGMLNGGNDGARQLLRDFWKAISDAGQLYSPLKLSQTEQLFHIKPEHSAAYWLFDTLTKMYSPYQFNPFNFNPLRDILGSFVDFDQIKAARSPDLYLSATNVKTGKIKIFHNEEISLDAVMASACLPFLFQSVEIQGEYYWDGGYMGNPAIFPLIYHSNVDDVLIIHINPILRDEVPESAADIMNRINEISFNSSLMREMRAIAFVTRLLEDGWIKEAFRHQMKSVKVHAIRADKVMQTFSVASKLNTDWEFMQALFAKGRELAKQWLDEHYEHVNHRSSIDLNEYL